jgi:hypothetical protein
MMNHASEILLFFLITGIGMFVVGVIIIFARRLTADMKRKEFYDNLFKNRLN